jgi:hypothetical protein
VLPWILGLRQMIEFGAVTPFQLSSTINNYDKNVWNFVNIALDLG